MNIWKKKLNIVKNHHWSFDVSTCWPQRWTNGLPNLANVGRRLGQPLAQRRANMMVQRRPDLHLYQGPTLACNVGPTMSVLSGQHWANVCMLTGKPSSMFCHLHCWFVLCTFLYSSKEFGMIVSLPILRAKLHCRKLFDKTLSPLALSVIWKYSLSKLHSILRIFVVQNCHLVLN